MKSNMNASLALVDKECIDSFKRACTNGLVRTIQFQLNDKTMNMRIVKKCDKGSSIRSDFDNLKRMLKPGEPCFILFRKDRPRGKWMFISWVPSSSKAPLKMMYSSSAGTLKRKLGREKFLKTDIFISEKNELTWKEFMEDDQELKEQLMTESEKARRERDKNPPPKFKLPGMNNPNVSLADFARYEIHGEKGSTYLNKEKLSNQGALKTNDKPKKYMKPKNDGFRTAPKKIGKLPKDDIFRTMPKKVSGPPKRSHKKYNNKVSTSLPNSLNKNPNALYNKQDADKKRPGMNTLTNLWENKAKQ